MKKLVIQILKFGVVGVIALLTDVGVLMLLREIFHVDVLWASGISFSVSVVVNYILSMKFVFESKDESKLKEFIVFVCLSIGGFFINQLIMWIGAELIDIYYLAVKAFALIFVSAYNFISRKIILEKKAP